MEKLIILQGLSQEQLLESVEQIIRKQLTELLAELKNQKPVKWLTRKEVTQLLHVTYPTLHEWTKTGLIKSYRISNRILYRSSEIDEALQKRRFS